MATPVKSARTDHETQPIRRSHRRLARWLVAVLAVVLVFYVVVGYLGCAGMFGDHARWRGMPSPIFESEPSYK